MKIVPLDRLPLAAVAPASRLGADYLAGLAAALPFYPHPPGGFAGAAEAISPRPRVDLSAALAAFNGELGAAEPALANARLLREPSSLAVVTGQQAAPLGGPLYTVLKAAAVVAWSRRIGAALGRPCVPVFWVEGDDHDAAEASTFVVGNDGRELTGLEVAWRETGGPVGDLELPWTREELGARLDSLLPSTARGAEARELALRGIESGRLGPWCCRFLSALFSGQGLVVAYSRQPALRTLWRPLVPRLLEEAPALADEAAEAAAGIRRAGYRPQVVKKAGMLPYFIIRGNRRLAVRREGAALLVGEERMAVAELARFLSDEPAAFSPGVLLRPLVQDFVLPTVAYVGGLAEASYFGQLPPLYRRMGIAVPAILPRLYATLVDPGRERVLQKLGLSPSRLAAEDADRLFSALVRRRGGPADPARWERLRERSRKPLLDLATRLPEDQAPLRGYLENVAGKIGHLVAEAGERLAREERSRGETLRRQIHETSFHLRPGGALQERTMNVLPFLARYGAGFPGALVDSMPDDLAWHWFLGIREDEA